MIYDEDPLRRRPREIDGKEIATREVCLDGKRNDQMAFHALADYQNHVIGWLQWEQSSLGDGAVVRFPRIWMSSGECRLKPIESCCGGSHQSQY